MSYPDMRYYITFFSYRYKDFEKSIRSNASKPKGRHKVHPDSSLIIFFAIMILKGIHPFKEIFLSLLSILSEIEDPRNAKGRVFQF